MLLLYIHLVHLVNQLSLIVISACKKAISIFVNFMQWPLLSRFACIFFFVPVLRIGSSNIEHNSMYASYILHTGKHNILAIV